MLYASVVKPNTKNDLYKELVDKLKTGGDGEAVFREIMEICGNCRPSSPIMCMEFCPIWKLKRKYRDAFKDLTEKPSLTTLLNITKNNRRLKILETLIGKPCSLKELRDELKETGYYHSLNLLRDHYVKPLTDAGFIKIEDGFYGVTDMGKSVYDILKENEVPKLPIHSKGYEERILRALPSGPKTHDELTKIVPSGSLYRSLKRLQLRNLIVRFNPSGRVFYFATKRRPTRRLSPTEMRVFKALPKGGISVKDLSEKVGISVRRVYKYLRRLRYKRHVRKRERTALYELTHAGRRLARLLDMAYNLIQSKSGY